MCMGGGFLEVCGLGQEENERRRNCSNSETAHSLTCKNSFTPISPYLNHGKQKRTISFEQCMSVEF